MAKPRFHSGSVPLSLPPSVAAQVGDESTALLNALATESPVSIRLNPLKPVAMPGTQVPWCPNGRYLSERPVFTLDPLLHAGCYYVQEASSMLLEVALDRTGLRGTDVLALDLCAAPGGKSTHLASFLSPGSLLVCNEPVPQRRHVLAENVWKHGRANTVISGSAPKALTPLEGWSDLVLMDAPCSGEGMFRKDPFAREQWSERLVNACAILQTEILTHAWHALRPGGWIVYSTCTWERKENEEQVKALEALGAEHVTLPIPEDWGIVRTDAGYRCYPHRVNGEGFFIALLRKPGSLSPRAASAKPYPVPADLPDWLRGAHNVRFIEQGEVLFACAGAWAQELASVSEHLPLVAPGIPVAERKGHAWRPHAALALNEVLNADAFTSVHLDREQALAFLRGETAFPMASDQGKAPGARLVRFQSHALGWLHPAGTRWNNGWPKEWRIRMR